MCGRSCGSSAGVASDRRGGRWGAVRKTMRGGRGERAQRAAPSLPHLGTAGTDPGAAIPLQLENSVGDGGGNVVEFLLSALSRRYQKSASGRVPRTFDASSAGQAADHLGRPAQSSQPPGVGLCPPTARTPVARIPSGLCSGTQSGGVSLVALEAARTTQLLPEHLRPVEPACASRAQADAQAPNPGDGFLAASTTVSLVSILCGTQ